MEQGTKTVFSQNDIKAIRDRVINLRFGSLKWGVLQSFEIFNSVYAFTLLNDDR